MKRLKYYVISIVAVCITFILASCGKEQMETPQNLIVDINNKLSWDAVENARSYVIHIKGISLEYDDEVYSRKSSYSLEKLAPGDYELQIKSVSSEDDVLESNWSQAYSFTRLYESGCVYTLINNGTEYEITKAGSASGDVIIEGEYRGLPVTQIAEYAFKGCGRIDSIVLPDTIKTLGNGAFYNCSGLKNITLPESVTYIGEAAFENCRNLTEITIPSKVEAIYKETFMYCRNLTKVNLPDTLKAIYENAFSNCITLKSFTLPRDCEYIGADCFSSNPELEEFHFNSKLTKTIGNTFKMDITLKTVTFPEDSLLETIGSNDFDGCKQLNNVILPSKLKTIGSAAFYDNEALDTVTVPDSVDTIHQSAFSKTKLVADARSKNENFVYAGNWVVYYLVGDTALDRIDATTFKDGTVGISDAVFAQVSSLTRVDLSKSMRYVGDYTFAMCTNLTRFTIQENSVVSLGKYCFYGDELLQNVKLREGLTSIGERCFLGCTIYKNNDQSDVQPIPDSLTSMGREAFKDTQFMTNNRDDSGLYYAGKWLAGFDYGDKGIPSTVEIREGTIGIADYVFYKTTVSSIQGIFNIKYIGKGSFYKCENLQSVVLNKNLKEIPDYTFYGCTALFNVTFPQNIKSIGQYAFGNCSRLDVVDLSKTKVTEIKDGTFYKCINLTQVDLPSTITRIGERAFYKCSGLESFTLPEDTMELGAMAFYGCSTLSSFEFNDKLTEIKHHTFGLCNFEELTIPKNIKTIGESAYRENYNLSSVTFEDGVEEIGDYAFYAANRLHKLVFPESVKTIGKFAFAANTELEEIYLPSTIDEIGAHAFYKCKAANIYTNALKSNSGWNGLLNTSNVPMLYGVTFDSTNTYVVSITVQKSLLNYAVVTDDGLAIACSNPTRDGYTFGGYKATIVDEQGVSTEIIYKSTEIIKVQEGTVLTAIWQ